MDTFDLQSLNEALTDIENNKTYNIFNMNEMMNCIEDIRFQEAKKTEVVSCFNKWVVDHPNHSFPKKRKKWVSGLQSQKNICVIYLRYDVSDILDNIRLQKPVPNFAQNMYHYVISFLKQINIDKIRTDDLEVLKKNHQDIYQQLYRRCVIIVRLSGEECIDILLERGVLVQKNTRLYRTTSLATRHVVKRNLDLKIDDGYDADTETKKSRQYKLITY